MAKKRERSNSGGAEWLNTYADLVTLLLTFFILLYAMSTVDAQKYEMLVHAFTQEFNPELLKNVNEETETNGVEIPEIIEDIEDTVETDEVDKLYDALQSYIQENNLQESVYISKSEEYVFIRFSDNVTFGGYSDVLNMDGKKILDVLGDGLDLVEDYIEEVIIAGHTAEVDHVQSKIDRSLSTNRANAVLYYLQDKNVINPAKYLAIGYGLYSPIADNDTPDGRAKNRRVEIFISRKGHPISYTQIIDGTLNDVSNIGQ